MDPQSIELVKESARTILEILQVLEADVFARTELFDLLVENLGADATLPDNGEELLKLLLGGTTLEDEGLIQVPIV